MKKSFCFVILSALLVFSNCHAVVTNAFWRNTPIVDVWMKPGSFLKNMPSYLSNTDFPPRKMGRVIPFSDGVTTVRILGGWSPNWPHSGELRDTPLAQTDIFDDNVNLFSRKLFDRISPYVNAGIRDFTIVLDNIPINLGINNSLHPLYGYAGLPKSRSISWLIGNRVSKALKNRYPQSTFRYRVGTEAGNRSRFNGTETDYLGHYISVTDGIRNVDENIDIMPFNASGVTYTDIHNNVSIERISPILKNKVKKLSAQPVSIYIQKKNSNTFSNTLKNRINNFTTYWDSIESKYGRRISREVHEFGLLDGKYRTSEIQKAAYHAEGIMRFSKANIDKLFHWHNTFYRGPRRNVLTPTGWTYAVLDHMAGGDWRFPTINANHQPGTEYFSAISKKGNKSILLVSSLNPNETNEYRTPTIVIPVSSLPQAYNICMTWIRDDLYTENDVVNSLTLKRYNNYSEIRGNTLIIRPLIKTNSVTAIIFVNNCLS
jgi:hypothetical protein